MQESRALQALRIPLSALSSVIFGMMVFAFPVGAYLVFGSEIGGDINYEYPLPGLGVLQAGDVFVALWCIYAVVFGVSMFGPRRSFLGAISPSAYGEYGKGSYMAAAIRWFAILVMVTAVMVLVQEQAGISIEQPASDNDLIQFVGITLAPLTEEIVFRVVLIGVPLYVMGLRRIPAGRLPWVLWHPHRNLHSTGPLKIAILVAISAVLFGAAHISFEESWSAGKLAPATVAGIILGWVYYRHGLIPALLIHWATNYVVFAYVLLVSDVGLIPIQEAFAHQMLQTFEAIFVAAGAVAAAFMVVWYRHTNTKGLVSS